MNCSTARGTCRSRSTWSKTFCRGLLRPSAAEHALRHHRKHLWIDAHRHLWRVRGAREDVERLADAHHSRIGEVEAAAVLALQVREMNHRVDDEVDRHQVEVAALDADQRDPARPGLAQLLQRLEEVVGPVDLVDHAGLRMPDDGAGPVDAEGHAAVGAHHPLGIVLGAVIRVIEVLGLLEHVLGERAAVESRRGDRAHEVEATGVDGVRERKRVLGAQDVRAVHRLGAGLDVVDGAEMEEVRDSCP